MFVFCILRFPWRSGVVELAIAEMACVSRNIRTAVPAVYGIPVQRSISERDVSHPTQQQVDS